MKIMKRAEKLPTIIMIVMFVFSIFNIGKVFASSDSLKITDVKINEKSSGVEASISKFDDDSISSNIKYHKLNEYVIYKVTLKNVDDEKHIIDLVIDNNNDNSNLVYEYDNYKNTILEPGKTVDIYIKEIYRNENTDLNNRSKTNKVKFTFNLIDDEKNESFIDIIVNPETKDNIYIYFALAGGSLVLLTLLVMKNRNKTGVKFFATLLFLCLISMPIITKALDSMDNIEFNSSIEFYDRFKVSYTVNGETTNKTVKYGEKLTRPKDPSKEGYKFIGWYQGDTKYDFGRSVTEDLNLTAKFIASTFTITYDLDGGNIYNPTKFKSSELPIKLASPYKLGFTFDGWTGSNGLDPMENITIDTAEDGLHFTANYSPINYEIKYIGLNDEELAILNNPTNYTILDTITLNNPSDIVNQNQEVLYRFVGWKDNNGVISQNVTITNSYENKTFEPIWQKMQADTFSITYNIPVGAYFIGETNPIEFNSQTDTFTLNNPVMDGYTFTGWTGSNGNVPEVEVTIHKGTTRNLEYTANFTPVEYTITYNLDGGVVDPNTPNNNTYTIESSAITLNNPAKDGYTFTGWTGSNGSVPNTSVTIPAHSTGNKEYTANYSIINYELNIDYKGGSLAPNEENPDHYNINDEITLYNPTKAGYTFTGWKVVGTETVLDSVTISHETGNKNYEAVFTPNHYTVVFHANFDGTMSGSMDPQVFTYDEGQYLTSVGFYNEDYDFTGWTTNDDGTGDGFTNHEFVLNLAESGQIDLYANWKKLKKSIFITGKDLNTRIAKVAGSRDNVLKIKYSTDVPAYAIANGGTYRVSISARSDVPTYIWFDSETGTLYYGGEADKILLNENSYLMFANLKYVTEIDTHFSTELVETFEQMFANDFLLNTLDVSHFKTSNATTMKSMFVQCRSMVSYDFSGWDVSNVQNFQHMFNGNNSVLELDLSNWYTTAATEMGNMFSSTFVMTSLKIDHFNTENVANLHGFCNDSKAIEELDFSMLNFKSATDLSGFVSNDIELKNIIMPSNPDGTPNLLKTNNMFLNCSKLTTVDVSGLDTAAVNTMGNMVDGMTSLTTIYADSSFVTTGMGTSNPQMFNNDTNLVGGAGTKYTDITSNANKMTYARIDNPSENKKGYFTLKQ